MDITTDLIRTAKEQTIIFTEKSSFQKCSRQLKLDIVNNKEHYLGYQSTSVWCYRHRCSQPAEIATDTVANATNIFSLATKNSGLVAKVATRF